MDFRRELLREHSKSQCSKIADYVGNSPARFKALVEVFLKGPYRVTQRAAWPLSVCVERSPGLASPHLNKLLDFSLKDGLHPSVRRNTMRILQYADVPTRLHGKVLDAAFAFLRDRKETIAVRVFSMSVIDKLCKNQPELLRELALILEDEMPYVTAAFRSRGSKILRRLSKEKGLRM